MPDLNLYHDPDSYGIVCELEKVLPEVVIDEMNALSGENIPLRHVEFNPVDRTTMRGANRYGHRFQLHIQTAMPVFQGAGGKHLAKGVRNDPRVVQVLAASGETLAVRVTYADAVWYDDEDDMQE